MNNVFIALIVLAASLLIVDQLQQYEFRQKRKLIQKRIDSLFIVDRFVKKHAPDAMCYAYLPEDDEVIIQFYNKPSEHHSADEIINKHS